MDELVAHQQAVELGVPSGRDRHPVGLEQLGVVQRTRRPLLGGRELHRRRDVDGHLRQIAVALEAAQQPAASLDGGRRRAPPVGQQRRLADLGAGDVAPHGALQGPSTGRPGKVAHVVLTDVGDVLVADTGVPVGAAVGQVLRRLADVGRAAGPSRTGTARPRRSGRGTGTPRADRHAASAGTAPRCSRCPACRAAGAPSARAAAPAAWCPRPRDRSGVQVGQRQAGRL